MSMLNITPSGYPEKARMIAVIAPQPRPKIIRPMGVTGVVT